MCTHTSPKSVQTYQAVARQSEDPEGESKGRLEDREGHGLHAGSRSDRDGGAESCSCTERNLRCDNAVLKCGRNRPTGNDRVAGTWTAYGLDRKVVSEWVSYGGSHGKEVKGKECIAGWGYRGRRKG
jgi:hypothetical protein